MRHFVKAGLFLFFLFLCPRSNAQFNVNTLFTPIDYRLSLELFQSVSRNGIQIVDAFGNTDITSAATISVIEDTHDDWKSWSFVENYAFGTDRGALPMITDLHSLHPFFRDQILTLITKCKAKGIELAVVETYRTHAKQHEFKSMGKKYTASGAGRSKHQYGLAVDVVPVINSVAVWNNAILWRKIGLIGEKLGLRWGGRWRTPYDPGHFEWTGGLTSYHLGAGKFPNLPSFNERYPCLEEDLKILKRYWEEWETSQSAWTRK